MILAAHISSKPVSRVSMGKRGERGRVEEMMVWIRELLSRISSRRLIELGGNAAGIVRRWPGIDFASQSRYILSPLHVLLSREYLAANTS